MAKYWFNTREIYAFLTLANLYCILNDDGLRHNQSRHVWRYTMYDVIHGVNVTGNVITRITFVETVTMFKLIRDKMDMCLANGLRFVCVCFCFSFTIFVSSSSCVYRYVWKKGSIKTLYINERLLVGRSTTVKGKTSVVWGSLCKVGTRASPWPHLRTTIWHNRRPLRTRTRSKSCGDNVRRRSLSTWAA